MVLANLHNVAADGELEAILERSKVQWLSHEDVFAVFRQWRNPLFPISNQKPPPLTVGIYLYDQERYRDRTKWTDVNQNRRLNCVSRSLGPGINYTEAFKTLEVGGTFYRRTHHIGYNVLRAEIADLDEAEHPALVHYRFEIGDGSDTSSSDTDTDEESTDSDDRASGNRHVASGKLTDGGAPIDLESGTDSGNRHVASVMQLGGQHGGVPTFGMAFPGYVQSENGDGNREMTWMPVLTGPGALGTSFSPPYAGIDGLPSSAGSSMFRDKESSTNNVNDLKKPMERPENGVSQSQSSNQSKQRLRYSEMSVSK